jgi:hypothetical protein
MLASLALLLHEPLRQPLCASVNTVGISLLHHRTLSIGFWKSQECGETRLGPAGDQEGWMLSWELKESGRREIQGRACQAEGLCVEMDREQLPGRASADLTPAVCTPGPGAVWGQPLCCSQERLLGSDLRSLLVGRRPLQGHVANGGTAVSSSGHGP